MEGYQGSNRKTIASLHQSMFDGVVGSGTARGDPDRAVGRGQVPIDRARTNDELFSDLNICLSLGNCQSIRYNRQ